MQEHWKYLEITCVSAQVFLATKKLNLGAFQDLCRQPLERKNGNERGLRSWSHVSWTVRFAWLSTGKQTTHMGAFAMRAKIAAETKYSTGNPPI